jgi:hypothetical protein
VKVLGAHLVFLAVGFGQISLNTAQIAKRVSPSVVLIMGKANYVTVLGSGFIVSKDGKVVTNLHVIRNLSRASVHMANGETFDSVSVLATDERRDLAIVKIHGVDLPALQLGDSNAVTVGERVVVVGNPRGLEGTVTAGILSSVRENDGSKVLQIDAAVNPGNSGGPLVNDRGQVIGVVLFKLRSAENLNFAVAINHVRELLANLHAPTSLEAMGNTLAEPSTEDQDGGPSLNETLDWLKSKIPLARVEYVGIDILNGEAVTKSVAIYGAATSFDSCTVVFGDTTTTTVKEHPERPAISSRNSYSVPLGALVDWTVKGQMNRESPRLVVLGGQAWSYRLSLVSRSKEIYHVWADLAHPEVSTVWDTLDHLELRFNDESLAHRVAKAFHHASDLCRKSEPF